MLKAIGSKLKRRKQRRRDDADDDIDGFCINDKRRPERRHAFPVDAVRRNDLPPFYYEEEGAGESARVAQELSLEMAPAFLHRHPRPTRLDLLPHLYEVIENRRRQRGVDALVDDRLRQIDDQFPPPIVPPSSSDAVQLPLPPLQKKSRSKIKPKPIPPPDYPTSPTLPPEPPSEPPPPSPPPPPPPLASRLRKFDSFGTPTRPSQMAAAAAQCNAGLLRGAASTQSLASPPPVPPPLETMPPSPIEKVSFELRSPSILSGLSSPASSTSGFSSGLKFSFDRGSVARRKEREFCDIDELSAMMEMTSTSSSGERCLRSKSASQLRPASVASSLSHRDEFTRSVSSCLPGGAMLGSVESGIGDATLAVSCHGFVSRSVISQPSSTASCSQLHRICQPPPCQRRIRSCCCCCRSAPARPISIDQHRRSSSTAPEDFAVREAAPLDDRFHAGGDSFHDLRQHRRFHSSHATSDVPSGKCRCAAAAAAAAATAASAAAATVAGPAGSGVTRRPPINEPLIRDEYYMEPVPSGLSPLPPPLSSRIGSSSSSEDEETRHLSSSATRPKVALRAVRTRAARPVSIDFSTDSGHYSCCSGGSEGSTIERVVREASKVLEEEEEEEEGEDEKEAIAVEYSDSKDESVLENRSEDTTKAMTSSCPPPPPSVSPPPSPNHYGRIFPTEDLAASATDKASDAAAENAYFLYDPSATQNNESDEADMKAAAAADDRRNRGQTATVVRTNSLRDQLRRCGDCAGGVAGIKDPRRSTIYLISEIVNDVANAGAAETTSLASFAPQHCSTAKKNDAADVPPPLPIRRGRASMPGDGAALAPFEHRPRSRVTFADRVETSPSIGVVPPRLPERNGAFKVKMMNVRIPGGHKSRVTRDEINHMTSAGFEREAIGSSCGM